VAGGGRIEKFH